MVKQKKHIKYHDIKIISVTDEFTFTEDFIVTEKIHGSNFSIGYIENELQIQSRNKLIDKDFQPFGLSEIIKPLIQIVEKIKDALNYNFLIYGEIFGKTIPTMNYYDSTCKAVFGSEKVFFRAFDLYNVDEKIYLKYSDAIALFEKVGLPYLPILTINDKTIGDLYAIVEKYQSAFSKKFVEGFVLKKNKNELSHTRNIFKIVRKEFKASNVQLLNKNKIKSYVNYKRFASAYSKIGDDLEEIKEEMIRDTLQDMMELINDEVREEVEEHYKEFQKKFEKEKEKFEKKQEKKREKEREIICEEVK